MPNQPSSSKNTSTPGRVAHDGIELGFVEIKKRGFPVVEQRDARLRAIKYAVAAGPTVQVARGRALAGGAVGEDELGRDERLIGRQRVLRSVGIDAR